MRAFGLRRAFRVRDAAVLLAVVASSAAQALPAAADPNVPACDGTWQTTPVPLGKTSDAILRAVSTDSASDAWVVGDAPDGHAFTAHWDGSAWTPVPVHRVMGHATLQSVAAVAPNDVWAVGSRQAHNGRVVTLIVHWDGSSWIVVPSPSPSRRANRLDGVAAAAGSAWAVGTTSANTVPFLTRTLALRWDGSVWNVVPTPNPGRHTGENALAAVSGGGATAWAAGLSGDPTDRGMLLRWQGKSWTVDRSLPPLGVQSSFASIDAPASRRILAVGTLDDGHARHMFSLRSRPGGWDLAAPPDPPGLVGTLHGVAWDAKSSAWAVGEADEQSNASATTLIERWDGSSWIVVTSPNPQPGSDILTGVASAGGATFASGYARSGPRFIPFAERYC